MGIQINGQTDTISAVDNNFSLAGNVSIGGTLTYEDVTSVDAVGLSTFKAGIRVTGGSVGIGTDNPTAKLHVVGGATIDGLIVTGIATIGDVNVIGSPGQNNTVFGKSSLEDVTIGSHNAVFGFFAGKEITSGSDNTACGNNALRDNTTGDSNIAVGKNALLFNDNADGNTGVGDNALNRNESGSNNTAIGLKAGYYIEGSNNTILGAYQGVADDSSLNGTVIISAGTTERFRINSAGYVGIGTDNPTTKLEVTGDLKVVNTGIAYLQPNTVTAFQAYESSGPVKISLNNNGTADFTGRVFCNQWFQSDRTTATDSAFYATVSGVEKLNIRANGSASFAAGAAVISSTGNLSINRTAGSNDILNGKLNGAVTTTINASGSIVWNSLAAGGGGGGYLSKDEIAQYANSSSANFFRGWDASGGSNVLRVQLKGNGGIANYQSNNVNLCDEREKKNIVSLETKWDKVKNWNLRKFHYNEDEDTDDLRYGVIAQEIEINNPELITDWIKQTAEDAVLDDDDNVVTPAKEEILRKGVKEQQMVWMAIKALQEAIAKIETLETQNTSLEARLTALEG